MSKVKGKFIFEKGFVPTKNRSYDPEVDVFIENVFKLEANKAQSILLPVEYFDEKGASNLINTARRRYSRKTLKSGETEKLPEFGVTIRKIYDSEGNYIGTRVWRII